MINFSRDIGDNYFPDDALEGGGEVPELAHQDREDQVDFGASDRKPFVDVQAPETFVGLTEKASDTGVQKSLSDAAAKDPEVASRLGAAVVAIKELLAKTGEKGVQAATELARSSLF